MTRSFLASALWCLALAACVRLPATMRPALPEEQAAILVLIAAHEAARGPTPWRSGTGESETCAIHWQSDPWHCDRALWDAVLADAWHRYTGD